MQVKDELVSRFSAQRSTKSSWYLPHKCTITCGVSVVHTRSSCSALDYVMETHTHRHQHHSTRAAPRGCQGVAMSRLTVACCGASRVCMLLEQLKGVRNNWYTCRLVERALQQSTAGPGLCVQERTIEQRRQPRCMATPIFQPVLLLRSPTLSSCHQNLVTCRFSEKGGCVAQHARPCRAMPGSHLDSPSDPPPSTSE